jgi:hypothetical protein
MTNTKESPVGFDNDFLNKIIVVYTLNLWFKNLVNLENLIFKDALWWHHNIIVVSKVDDLCKDILMEYHDAFYSRHMDITKTLKQVQIRFWLPNLRDDIKKYVNSCRVCQCSNAFITGLTSTKQVAKITMQYWCMWIN